MISDAISASVCSEVLYIFAVLGHDAQTGQMAKCIGVLLPVALRVLDH